MLSPTALGSLNRFVPRVATEWDLDARGARWQALDATLCFVDISGFTNLSERLAMRGRIGAEELTDVLNRVFGSMLDIAYSRGGSLLKFGGDALLLQFDGPDHPVQAASAAVEMRSALRTATQIPVSVGRLRLRMSVGLHSGTVHLFRAGTRHDELIVTGPAATRTTEMEHAAEAGDIFVSPETAARLPRGATRPGPPPAEVLRWRSAHAVRTGSRARRLVAADRTAAWLPPILRDHLQSGDVEFEHRIASVAFLRFQRVDELMASEGIDAVASALHELVSATQAAAEDQGVAFLGSDLDSDGGKLILVSGVPRSQEDDEGRMLRALRAVADTTLPLPLQIGANRGHVFAGTIGAEHRATFTIIGDTVNLAARLMAAAPYGQVYATAALLDGSRDAFEATTVPPFHVKGKAQPVQAYTVGDDIGRRAASTGEGPFVGRAEERETLTAALHGGGSLSAGPITVVGKTGLGKSRLIHEAIASAAVPALVLRGEPNGMAIPYRTFRDGVRGLLALTRGERSSMVEQLDRAISRLDPELRPYTPFLGDVTHIDVPLTAEVRTIEPRFRPDRLADTVIRVLEGRLGHRAAIIVDDAQWTDAASNALLTRIVDAAPRAGWTVLVGRRDVPGGFEPSGGRRIELGPLDDAALRELVVASTNIPLRPDELDHLVDRAAGSPLVLGALLWLGQDSGVDDLPDSLEELVAAEIDVLAPLPRQLLRHAAVLGQSFSPDVWRELLRADGIELDDASSDALAHFLEVDEAGSVRFRQAVVRDVAYRGLSYRRRRELHARAGHAIERAITGAIDSSAAPLALHFSESGDYARAWQYGVLAADRARAAYANTDAAAMYRRALDAARRLDSVGTDERLQTWTKLGDVLEQAGRLEEALDAYRRASALAGTRAVPRALSLLKRARARERAGAFVAALRELTVAERALAGDPSDEASRVRVAIHTYRAVVHEGQEQPNRALAAAQRAAAEAEQLGELRELAKAYDVIDWAHAVRGELEQAVHAPLIVEIHRSLGEGERAAGALGNHGAVQYWLGHWSEALDSYERAGEAYRRRGDVVNAAIQQSNVAELLINRRQFAAARTVIVEAVRTHRAVGFVDGALFDEIQLGRLVLGEGNPARAAGMLRAVRAEASSFELRGTALQAGIHLAECLVADGDSDEALEVLADAERAAVAEVAVFAASVALVRGLALGTQGEIDAARATVGLGIAAARRMGMTYELGMLLILDAELTGSESSREEGLAILLTLDVPNPEPMLSRG
jgi:class 3 adenylate cyclase/tetratricopeptide (TPR) repeat protein